MRGRNFNDRERNDIRVLHQKGFSVRDIARYLGRGKSGVQGQIDRMRRDGSLDQKVLGFWGQESTDERK